MNPSWYIWPKLITTLGSIFDSQLIWESGKFQLARWSHNVALFSTRNHPPAPHPPTRSTYFFLTSTYPKKLRFGMQPNLTNLSCLGHLSRQHLSSSLNLVRCPPLVYTSGVCSVPPVLRIKCGVPTLIWISNQIPSNRMCGVPPPSLLLIRHLRTLWGIPTKPLSYNFVRCPHPSLNIRPDVQNWKVRCLPQLIL